ncbi:hypothetical protein B0H16DRAFT_1310894 [Mycena metata]|uniref:Uncharacterized protein n=1 Tax=Mycena metata TaxID=1033252 RepID=A0AAD7NKL6_9AGAR|nr:hypothetical protein B0H16DRAFT_1310894 [Mycena metata]
MHRYTGVSANIGSSPVGLKWDAVDHSCAFDATFTVLINIWKEEPVQWTCNYNLLGGLMAYFSSTLEDLNMDILTLEQARDKMRYEMRLCTPQNFPYGVTGTSIDKIMSTLLPVDRTYASGNRICNICGYSDPELRHLFNPYICAIPSAAQAANHPSGIPVSTWLTDHLRRGYARCPRCALNGDHNRLSVAYNVTTTPDLLVLALDRPGLEFSSTITLDVNGTMRVLKLRGIIYGGDHHFTSRYISLSGSVWFHDGITTGRSCIYEGLLSDLTNSYMTSARGKQAINLIYARLN